MLSPTIDKEIMALLGDEMLATSAKREIHYNALPSLVA
jgi:hypothetical protein